MEYNANRIHEIFKEEENKSATARAYCKEIGVDYTDGIRRYISNILSGERLADEPQKVSSKTETKPNNYTKDEKFYLSAWNKETGKILDIEEYCKKYNLPFEQLKSFKFLPYHYAEPSYNIVFGEEVIGASIDNEFIESVIEKHISPSVITIDKDLQSNKEWVDRLVITDVHIGMDTGGGRNTRALYNSEWNKTELFNRLETVIKHVNTFKKGSEIVVDELGDLLDGLLGETVRKGHHLPQNMNDKEAFEVAIKFVISLIESLLTIYDKVTFNSITNDNHSGIFSYFVNSTIKKIIEAKHKERVVHNVIERFIDHYSIGCHTFLICHGKDSESLKFGFKPFLDTKQMEKIDQYCKENNLYNGSDIEFSKGDSHQCVFDYTTSNDFDYFNYPAFSPPSNWVKTNFKNAGSGFVFQNISKKENIKTQIPYWFKN